jgi:hypothetical protein
MSIRAGAVRIGAERQVNPHETVSNRHSTAARHDMTPYLLNIYQPEGTPPPPDVLARIMRDVGAVVEATKTAGVWVFNGGLTAPGSATVVRARADEVLLTDGPYVEGKEFIGGFLIVRAADLDEALRWAQKLSQATTLPIEVRAFHFHG